LQNQLFEKQITTEDLNDASILQLKRRVYAVEQSIRQLQNQMADTYQISINGQQQQTASVEDVRTKLLRKNERWIEYYTDPDSSQVYLISIGKNDLRFIRRPYQEAAVRTFIQLFNNEIQAENKAGDPALFAAFVAAARQLYSNLVEPAFSGEMPERLTLAPDGALALLPFDVLVHEPVPADAPVNYGELPYLVFSSQLRLVPSASLDLFYTHQAQTEVRGPYAGFAPDYSGSILGQVVSGSDVVKSAAAAFKGRAFIGPDAGLDAFLQTAPGHAIIHFHGHAEASDSFPDHSWMAFTAGRPIAETLLPQDPARLLGRRPGRLPASELEHCLFAHQVYYAHLNAELVLLSACQTGLGKIAPGEGTLSLSRAFQAAGCPATVMSLWEVRDDATAELMRLFLENIRLGQDKDEALTNAKRSYLKSTGDAFPYYWAGFVLTGKADPVRLSAPWWKSPFTWILLLGCLALALFIFRKKSSSRVME
jgi:CHAT domain-containing protein